MTHELLERSTRREVDLHCGGKVVDMDRLPVDDGSARHGVPVEGATLGADPWLRCIGMARVDGCQLQDVTLQPMHIRNARIAHPRGRFRHGVQDRLQLGRRAADHPRDLAGGRLLLQRLGGRSPQVGILTPESLDLAAEAVDLPLETGTGVGVRSVHCDQIARSTATRDGAAATGMVVHPTMCAGCSA
jgi:hypothetical protein